MPLTIAASAMADSPNILVVDDEANMRHMLSQLLEKSGYRVTCAANGKDALAQLEHKSFAFIFCDVRMPLMDGMAFLQASRGKTAGAAIIMMSAYGTIDTAVQAMNIGAYDYISKPFKHDEVILTLKKAEERERLKRENRQLKECIRGVEAKLGFGGMIATSRCMGHVFELAQKVSRYATTVLITGESGTGKELVARGIHASSLRADRPLVPVNCAGIPETLLESELFGFAKGAFTGADRARRGLFEEADGGTLFLDEIGDLSVALQVKLLRVLQENEIRPLGESQTRHVDVRVIAATAKELKQEVRRGTFREDLYYRLNVVNIRLPPLRERVEDIPVLCRLFMKRFQSRLGKPVEGITPAALELLLTHDWPGNVRELENAIEHAVVLTESLILDVDSLPIGGSGALRPAVRGKTSGGYSLKSARRELEKHLISRALEFTGGNRSQAARLLEISHPSLLSKIKLYGIV